LTTQAHFDLPPSPWVQRWASSIRPGGAVLDVAAGGGRHAKLLARLGFEVDAVDRDPTLFADAPARVRLLEADLEAGAWPYEGRKFDAIVVTNYLHRPLFPVLVGSLEPGGMLIYETFARGNERFGKPSNPAFLLAPGELLEAVLSPSSPRCSPTARSTCRASRRSSTGMWTRGPTAS
jgi:SAM-dependent methyltransferase